MKEHGKVTERQFAGIIANAIIGVGILTIPRVATREAGTGGWISLIIAGLTALFFLFLLLRLGLRFPEETLMEYAPRVLGNFLGKAVGVIISLYWILISGVVIRIFGEMLVSSVFDKTPIQVLLIAMLVVVVYFIRHDIEVFGRINEIYFIFIILPLTLGIALSLRQISVIKLMPVLGNHGLYPIFTNSLSLFFSFLGFELVVLFVPSITTPKLVFNYGFKGWVTPFLSYLIVIILGVGVFGVRDLQNLTWPLVELTKVIKFPGLLLERVEAFFVSFWVVAVFTTSSNFFYGGVVGLSQVLHLEEHKTLIFPLLPLVFFISMFPDNIYQVFMVSEIIGKIGGILITTTTLSLYLIAIIKGIKGDELT